MVRAKGCNKVHQPGELRWQWIFPILNTEYTLENEHGDPQIDGLEKVLYLL